MRIGLSALALVFACAATGHAQLQRWLPANGKLGQAYGQQRPYAMARIDRKALRLAPGGVIIDQNNRFILHGALPAEAAVRHVVDTRGEISRMILLTPEELTQLVQAGKR